MEHGAYREGGVRNLSRGDVARSLSRFPYFRLQGGPSALGKKYVPGDGNKCEPEMD